MCIYSWYDSCVVPDSKTDTRRYWPSGGIWLVLFLFPRRAKKDTTLISPPLPPFLNSPPQSGGHDVSLPQHCSIALNASQKVRQLVAGGESEWSFTADDGLRGGWILIIWGSSLITSRAKGKKHFLTGDGTGTVLCNINHNGGPHNSKPWVKSFTAQCWQSVFPQIYPRVAIAHF